MPALRTRGVNLAIVTLGIGVIVDEVVLGNTNYTGGFSGTQVQPPTLFGLSLDAEVSPARYFLLCLAFLVACAVAVSNLRRSSVGRYLIAVRGNERAAASLGLNVAGLDEQESAGLAGLLRMLADRWGLGILLVEHDVSLVMRVSDRIAALDFGQLLCVGEPEQVRRDPRVISAYLGATADAPSPGQDPEKAKAEG
ncbi:MAG TPA: hypothetical protein VMI73_05990 [Trebonia sp.]|nr:hypothetical protein [Trebonia sp.]